MQLRDDQSDLIAELDWRIENGARRTIIQCPTGYGKTVVAGSLVARELNDKRKTLFVVPAISLVNQTIEMFRRFGIEDIGVIQAQHEMTNWDMPVQIASVQTLMRRNIPDAELVIIDEVHMWFEFYSKWLRDTKWQDIPFVGLSATPWRKGLGAYFTDLIIATTTAEMIEKGLLSDFKVYAPSSPDLKGVRTVAGDYHEGQLSERMAPLVADIVKTWLEKAQDRPTLVFAVDRTHAKNLQQQFEASGVPAAYQDAYTKDDERAIIRGRFHSGEIKVVVSVGTLTTGIDWDVRCIVLARPTKSEILYTQIIGRGLRTATGKDHCLILDHSDTTLRLGFVTDIRHDTLDDGKSPTVSKSDAIKLPKKCPKCSYLKPPKTAVCPACGFKAEAIDKTKVVDGQLIQLDRKKNKPIDLISPESFYRQLLYVARQRGYKDAWAAYKFRERFNSEPEKGWYSRGVETATMAVAMWVKSQQIKWANSRKNPHAQRHTPAGGRPMDKHPTLPWD